MKPFWRRVLLAVLLSGAAVGAWAHKASDAYLQLDGDARGLTVRWDIALRDLDAAVDLDADENGRLTWGEIKAGWPKIEAYATAGLRIDGCPLRLADRALERRNDGAYAVLFLDSRCVLTAPPVMHYTLFRDIDPTHRGIAKIRLAGRPDALAMLDPTQQSAVDRAPTAQTGNAPASFLREGVHHILTGYDHVLFLLCLLLPSVMRRTARGWRPVERLSQAVLPVIGIVSAFTVAHSITLGLAALKLVAIPPSIIEPAIAVTIVLAALDNVWPVFPVRRVVVTFAFGLIHGFGFAGVLSELDLPTGAFAWALLQFNLGLELGQLLIVCCTTALLFLLRDLARYPALVIRGGSLAAMAVGALWFVERTANVSLLPMPGFL